MTADASRPARVVVIGAGFGGLNVARGLAGKDVEVVLVDRNNYHTFQPLLYQVATAGLHPADVGHPIRTIFRKTPNVRPRHGTVVEIDRRQRVVVLDDGERLRFDYLVVAAGGTTTSFGIPGADEHALPLYQLQGALRLRNHILGCFESADAHPEQAEAGALTFVVVGGGPTGVELAGALIELFETVLRKDFPGIDMSSARVVLVEMVDSLLPSFGESSRRNAEEALEERGVEVMTGEAVAAIDPGCVRLKSGKEIPAHTVIWATGVTANPLSRALGAELARGGRVVVERDLSVPGDAGVFVVGDLAAAEDPRGNTYPQLAPVAIQQGRHVARQILRDIDGKRRRAFRYRDRGVMATIGRRAAVAELPLGVRLSGTLAWFAWLALHLVWLIGFRNRVSVLINWAWNYIGWERGPRLILERADED